MQRCFSRLSSVEFGAYYHFCSTPLIHSASSKALAAQQKLIDAHSGKVIGNSASSLPIDEAEPFLTTLHELDHLRSFYTSVFGLAMWRLSHLINVCLTFAFRRRGEIEGWWDHLEPSLPLSTWAMRKVNDLSRAQEASKQRTLLRILCGAADAVRFQEALTDRPQMTVGEFVDLANRVGELAARLAGRPAPRWTSERSSHEPYLEGTPFTCRQVLEASAVLHEIHVSGQAGYDESAISQLTSSLDRETYTRCMAATLNMVDDLQLAFVAFDEALNGDLDVVGQRERVLERDHPAWRFKHIVEGMRRMDASRRPTRQGRVVTNDDLEAACRLANLASSNTIVKGVLDQANDIEKVLGQPSHTLVSTATGAAEQVISTDTRFIQRRALNEIVTCLKKRSVDPFRKIQPRPLLVLYQDDVSVTALKDFGGSLSRDQVMIAIGDIVFTLAAWSLFVGSDGDTTRVAAVQKACERFYSASQMDFLRKAMKTEQEGDWAGFTPYTAMVPEQMLRGMLPGKLFGLLRWTDDTHFVE